MISVVSALRLPELLHATDRFADEVLRGHHDHRLPDGGLPTDARWFTRLHSDGDLDVWLISWVRGHATELHDHADSVGALTVLSGTLAEYRWDRDRLKHRRLRAGDQAAFPQGWVHDVVWAPDASAPDPTPAPTLSVHAYSPPLTTMSYYEVAGRQLQRTRTERTDQPEAS
ncbi:cysteine dioxygenase family protein [Mycobacterium koreense]|uniref:Cysteine dioxygenase n=1 Tax=Mycolicibacillus koreensis TaxID=1069220 RepID=A0A7I7SLD4_9MYCO|nr:cysteine dioxygenase family protein [Mycolicibacillus koreensis]MCV7249645.1 cysteine dioxygenase family protein [Mycolicibacillus koreensis]OSC31457.1 cysteine dioxygenase [Mycolicibacillus koreensis]BBY56756.1 hypothetical protein MKOR_40070 [Mycolicibacillus koreensis]